MTLTIKYNKETEKAAADLEARAKAMMGYKIRRCKDNPALKYGYIECTSPRENKISSDIT